MNWFEYSICVPYGNPNYDVQLGGSHDLDVRTPLGTPVTFLKGGTVTDVSAPSWGRQVCLELDTPVDNGHGPVSYMAYLHLGYVEPDITVGRHVNAGDAIGLSGGATYPAQAGGQFLFINTPEMSSQPQTGVALMSGPSYGSGAGWDTIDPRYDPTFLIEEAIKNLQQPSEVGPEEAGNLSVEEVPAGWSRNSDGKLVASNGVVVAEGFEQYVLSHKHDPGNVPEEAEYGVNPVLESQPSLGGGDRQSFRDFQLWYTAEKGVNVTDTGAELKYVRADRNNRAKLMADLSAQVTALKAGLPVAQIKQAMTDLQTVIDYLGRLSS